MILFILKILGAWLVLTLISAPVLIPILLRRFVRHDEWVENSKRPPLKMYRFPEIRETHRPR
jgi:hypothetical protein